MKKLVVTLFFIAGIVIFSCNKKCSDVEPYFQIKALNPYNLEFTNEGSNPWTPATENDTIQWENYFNRVEFACDYIVSNSNQKSYSGTSLYALDCLVQGHNGSKIGVENVHIVTLNDFDSLYSANDTIDTIVKFNYWTFSVNDYSEFISIDEYIDQNQITIQEKRFEFKLTSPPSNAFQTAKFKIIYKLVNGESFEAITEEVVLRL